MQVEFRAEYGQSPADCLDQLAAAGADLHGTSIESFARSLERSRKMLGLMNSAVLLLRKRHKKGELYYSYLTPQEYENTEAILHALEAHFPPMSLRALNDSALCTVIFADFRNEQIRIHNYTEDFLLRAFGVVEQPEWEDFIWLLQERCLPADRARVKQALQKIHSRCGWEPYR